MKNEKFNITNSHINSTDNNKNKSDIDIINNNRTIYNNEMKNSKYNKYLIKNINSYYLMIFLSVLIPFCIFLLVLYIYYRFRKRMKLKKQKEKYDINRIHKNEPKVKESYKKIMNTSGINNINQINSNNIELNIKNMNEEFNNIINNNNNNTGSSSGRRKREKKKLIKKKENNIMEFDLKEGQKGIQNEIKEQIKQFVIEEHNNNNNNDALNNENNI